MRKTRQFERFVDRPSLARRWRASLVVAAMTTATLFGGTPAHAQVVRMTIPQYFVWSASADIANALAAVASYANQKAELVKELAATREAYWAQLPDGPDLEAAREAYSTALVKKDMLNGDNLAAKLELGDMQVGGGLRGQFAGVAQERIREMEKLTGGAIEPTHPFAYYEFEAWVRAFVDAKQRTKDVERAFNAALPKYAEYTIARDQAEYLWGCPKGPFASEDPRVVLGGVMAMHKGMPEEEKKRQVDDLLAAVNDPKVLVEAGREVRDYLNKIDLSSYGIYAVRLDEFPRPKTRTPEKPMWSFRPGSADVLVNTLSTKGGRLAPLCLIKQQTRRSWADADATLKEWEAKAGAERVAATTAKVIAAFADPATVDDRERRVAETPWGSIAMELGVALPLTVEEQYWLDAYKAAVQSMDRAVLSVQAQAMFAADGAPPATAAARYAAATKVIDETLVLAALQDSTTHEGFSPLIALQNFALATRDDKTFALVVIGEGVTKDGGPLYGTADFYAKVWNEYDRLRAAHGQEKLSRASAAVRCAYSVYDRGVYLEQPYAYDARPTSSYEKMIARLGEKVVDKVAVARAARIANTQREPAGAFATALALAKDPQGLLGQPGWNVKELTEMATLWDRYIEEADATTLWTLEMKTNTLLMSFSNRADLQQRQFNDGKARMTPDRLAKAKAEIDALVRMRDELQKRYGPIKAEHEDPNREERNKARAIATAPPPPPSPAPEPVATPATPADSAPPQSGPRRGRSGRETGSTDPSTPAAPTGGRGGRGGRGQ